MKMENLRAHAKITSRLGHRISGSPLNAAHSQNPRHIDGYASDFAPSDRSNLTPTCAPKREVIFAWALRLRLATRIRLESPQVAFPGLYVILPLAVLFSAVGSAEIYFLDSKLEDGDKGQRLILSFHPKPPEYTTFYGKEKNVSEVRWKSNALAKYFKKIIFPDADKPFSKVYVWADPKQKRGLLQLWHRGPSRYQLTRISDTQLALLISPPPKPEKQLASLAPIPLPPLIETPPKETLKETPKKITLNVKQVALDKVLRTVASEAGKSMVFGEEVSGTVTIALKNLGYEEAVDMILRPTKYRADHTRNVTIIRSAKEGKSFRAFRLKYVDVNGIIKSVQDMVKEGQATSDPNTNSIFVSDTMDSLNQIDTMLSTIDQIPKQVDVESAIIDLEGSEALDLGFNISGLVKSGKGDDVVANQINSARISPFDPATAAPKGLFVGLSWKSVQGILGALSQNTKLTILARPRVVALNDQEASIIIGSKLGYKTLTVTTTGTVEDVKFLTVGTQLTITPHITANNDIIMKIKPEVSDGSLDAKTGVPSENTTSSETKVLAKDGQTIVIGGLLRDRTEKTETKVPILGDIPIFGFFFKGKSETTKKTEVMILLAPRIVNQEVLRGQEIEAAMALDKAYGERLKSLAPPSRSSIK